MKFKTVREGQQALVFNHLGESELIVGPKRVFLHRKRLQMLKRYTANARQYLVLKDKDGVVTHKPGPCVVYFNTVLYDSILERAAIQVDSNHIIVVYRRLETGGVDRTIKQGPCLFVPDVKEWLHEFKWHGNDPSDKGRLVANGNIFTKLQTIPGHFYYDVREVRTNDDTMIKVKLMLFYELEDIIKMLETTHDPIADMMNAICADVIAFAGKLSFDQFVGKTSKLSELSTYQQLELSGNKIGFRIQKVVYCGYHSSETLQEMQNNAIESRTRLRLNAELQNQERLILDLKLNKEQARSHLKNEMEKSRQDHKHQIEILKQSHDLHLRESHYNQNLMLESELTLAQIGHKENEDKQKLSYLQFLRNRNVDLNQVLLSQPIKEEIRVVNKSQ
ncbi:hypothetical protein SNE40_017106 [Patella caerulea]|uniref:Band 7 domain-containing protein n=1 Tax=Patella caerulea TaxID=87958 RepID=A0AAN8PPL1_PATCE